VTDLDRFINVLATVHVVNEAEVPLLRRARAVQRLLNGEPLETVAREARLPRARLGAWKDAITVDGLYAWLGKPEPTLERRARARASIAQMVLGSLAEEHFEALASRLLRGFSIEDDRTVRNDTDYRLLDKEERPVCRFNVKFHGTLFRESVEYVGLESDDCFALATYKIHQALRRQEDERLPYVFLVISVPGVPRERIEIAVADDLSWLRSLSDRTTEEAIVRHLVGMPWVGEIRDEIRRAEFRVISARRANQLLRDRLFERVHALRLRAFNRTFRGAEINMHLSLSTEMISLADFLGTLATTGVQGLSVRLERGEI